MQLLVISKKDNKYLYIVKKPRINKKSTTEVLEKCGRLSDLEKQYDDPNEYFKNQAKEMTEKEKEENSNLTLAKFQRKKITSEKEILLNGGYLFLRKIYRALELDKLTDDISKKYKIKYDLN